MSWDYDTKIIKCPCGKGFISQQSKSDDWGRTEYYTPSIECSDCSQKYKVEMEQHFCHKWDGDGINYFLTPKDYPEYNGIKESDKFPAETSNIRKYNEWFTEKYTKAQLQSALNEFQEKKSSSKVELRESKEIAKEHKRVFNTAKVSEILHRLQQIIENYDSYIGNYEQRKPIRDEERKQRAAYTEEKRKHQIFLQEF